MTLRDLSWRGAGLAVTIGASGLMLERGAHAGDGDALSAGIASAIGLTGFALSCFGVILLIRGAAIRDRWVKVLRRRVARCTAEARPINEQ